MDGIVIGIDGGGTTTSVVAIEIASSMPPIPVARANGGPCNIAMMSVAEALGNVADCILRLDIDTATVMSICAGIAGFSFEERRRDFMAGLASLAPNGLATVIPDFVAAHIGRLKAVTASLQLRGPARWHMAVIRPVASTVLADMAT